MTPEPSFQTASIEPRSDLYMTVVTSFPDAPTVSQGKVEWKHSGTVDLGHGHWAHSYERGEP